MHFKREDEGGAARIYANGGSIPAAPANGFGRGRGGRTVPGAALVPGAAPGGGVSLAGTGTGADEEQGLSKAALKNKKKREAAKKAKEEAAANPPSAAALEAAGKQNGKGMFRGVMEVELRKWLIGL